MSRFSKSLLVGLLEQENTIKAFFGGGFKPPTKGHFLAVKKALENYPEIDTLYVVIGSGLRDNISQEEAQSIWEMYKNYLPIDKVEIIKAKSSPLKHIKDYIKTNTDHKSYIIIGTREDNDEDTNDLIKRKDLFDRYGDHVEVKNIITKGGVSGTKARDAAKISKEQFYQFLPGELSNEERQTIFNYINSAIQEGGKKEEKLENVLTDKIKLKLKFILKALKQENKKTREAFSKIVQDARGDITLTDEDKKEIGDQMKNVLKLAGLTTIALVPGGTIAAILIKLFKVENTFLPTSFQKEKDIEETKELVTEEESYDTFDYNTHILSLVEFMLDLDLNINPLPDVKFINDDVANADNFFGKTAYYDPQYDRIVLYTLNRHPKDVMRSFAHEMIHHMQNCEDRLGEISTQNTNEDDHLEDIEREAYEKGNICFRKWTDTLTEGVLGGENKWINEEDVLMDEVVNPDGDIFEYNQPQQGLFIYKDSKDNLYFARITFQPTKDPHFEFKVGWFEDNDIKKPKYEPNLPPNSTSLDNIKRRNTVSKIYRDEVLTIFKKSSKLSNILIIDPITTSRFIFSQRLVQNHTPNNFNIAVDNEKNILTISILEGINNLSKYNYEQNLPEKLWHTINEIQLNPNNSVELNGDLTEGEFNVGGITYIYSIKKINNPYEDEGSFYNITFTPSDNEISTPTGDSTKENYIKILNTMYKIILDFTEENQPEYIGISSLDNDKNKNYHQVYNNLTDNNHNRIPGYFRKDSNLTFTSSQGNGRFIVLKKKTEKTPLNEGRYDKITNNLSGQVFNKWKDDFNSDLSDGFYEEYIETNELEFYLVAKILFTSNNGSLSIDGGVEEIEGDDFPTISLDFSVDPDTLPQMWEEISMNLKDTLRHEIEHLTQNDEESFPTKFMGDDQHIRGLIDAGVLNKKRYFQLEKEVDANLQGLYFRAKKEHLPFKKVIDNYLNTQSLSSEEKEEILKVWRTRSSSLSLPKF